MAEDNPVLNLGDLGKPATALIEKVSDAIGGIFKPWQIRRVSQAQAEADKLAAITQLEITDIQHRAIHRMMIEETHKQQNIESITTQALPLLTATSAPTAIENDWIVNFFDRCRLISDTEMQDLWSRVLAGEANSQGSYSKRTVNLLGSLDKKDALLFTSLCRFSPETEVLPLVYEPDDDIYKREGLQFEPLKHLDSIGLISFESLSGYQLRERPRRISFGLCGKQCTLEFEKDEGNNFDIGHVMLTQAGRELAGLCSPNPVPGFEEYLLARWRKAGYAVTMSSRMDDATRNM